eukprot:scaffold44240_cov59-Phaeocystis_antarctica.AAC.5
MERSDACPRGVRCCAAAKQRQCSGGLPVEGCAVQRAVPLSVHCGNGRAGLQQRAHRRRVAAPRCNVERKAVLGAAAQKTRGQHEGWVALALALRSPAHALSVVRMRVGWVDCSLRHIRWQRVEIKLRKARNAGRSEHRSCAHVPATRQRGQAVLPVWRRRRAAGLHQVVGANGDGKHRGQRNELRIATLPWSWFRHRPPSLFT